MVVNIRDLYGNSGKRFKKINTRQNFQKNTPYLNYFTCLCLLCGYFPDPLRFKRFPLFDFKGLNFNIERRETSNRPIVPSFEKGTEKSANDSLRRPYSVDVHTHTSYRHTQICNHVLGGKNSSKGLNFSKE